MTEETKLTDQEIGLSYQRQKNELQSLATKIGDLESNADEHSLVLTTLKEAEAKDPKRKCFRMIGGVLVELTVSDVSPTLEANLSEMKKIMDNLVQQYVEKDKSFAAFQKKHNIQQQTKPPVPR